MKNRMHCLLPSKIAPRGRGVDDLLTRGHQMRRAIFIVVTLVGIIGATASSAQDSWQRKTLKGSPGEVSYFDVYRGAEGGMCGDHSATDRSIPPCTQTYNWIFISRFWVYPAVPYSVSQTIRVTAYLYEYSFQYSKWIQSPVIRGSWWPSVLSFYNLRWIFGSPPSDYNVGCPFGTGCTPALEWIPSGMGKFYTVLVQISWRDSSGNELALANYIPPPADLAHNIHHIGCAGFAMLNNPQRCYQFDSAATAVGLPTDASSVGYLYFP
jgi:hypothetical protein